MAGNKQTPRQKMIGMMYLVLTALLALNVQKEVLNAFVELDDGIRKTTRTGQFKSEALYSDFKFAHNLDPQKTSKYWNDSQEIKKKISKAANYLDSIKTLVVAQTEGLPFEVADTLSLGQVELLESYDEPTRIMVGAKEDASEGEARKIKDKLIKLEEEINGFMIKHGLPELKIPIDFSDRTNEGVTQNWETHTFYDTPLAGTVAMLSKFANDIRNMEYASVSQLFAQIDSEDIPIDTVSARVIPKSNYVLLGDEYQSDIFLGAYSTTAKPKIEIGKLNEKKNGFVGESNELDVKDGAGKFNFLTNSEGLKEYEGLVTLYDKQGNEKVYPFQSSYMVAKPSAVISATKMNVLYKGVDNPVSISVPGLADENVIVSIQGSSTISKVSNGNFVVKLNNSAPQTVKIQVSARGEDGQISPMGSMDFRTKKLPKPSVRFQEVKDFARLKKNDIKNVPGLIAEYGDDFLFNLPRPKIEYFEVVFEREGEISPKKICRDRGFTEEIKNKLINVRTGDKIYITDVRVRGNDDVLHPVNNIALQVIQ